MKSNHLGEDALSFGLLSSNGPGTTFLGAVDEPPGLPKPPDGYRGIMLLPILLPPRLGERGAKGERLGEESFRLLMHLDSETW